MTTKSIFLKFILVHPPNQAWSLPPSSNITLVFEEGRCYIYYYFFYCRYIVHYAMLLNHFFIVSLLL
jgi:hypothetical protein